MIVSGCKRVTRGISNHHIARSSVHQQPSMISDRYVIICRGIGLSRYRTRMLSTESWLRPLVLPLYIANDSRKIFRHCLRYRQDVIQDDVAACELTLYIASLISPFFMAQRSIKRQMQKHGLLLN